MLCVVIEHLVGIMGLLVVRVVRGSSKGPYGNSWAISAGVAKTARSPNTTGIGVSIVVCRNVWHVG